MQSIMIHLLQFIYKILPIWCFSFKTIEFLVPNNKLKSKLCIEWLSIAVLFFNFCLHGMANTD